MDPLSEVLSLLKLKTFVSGGFEVAGGTRLEFHEHVGIKCYALVSGACWLTVEGVSESVQIQQGDCVLLPSGRSFSLATDRSGLRVKFDPAVMARGPGYALLHQAQGGAFLLGGQFVLTGGHSEILLHSLPPIVHVRREASKNVLRWSLESLREELSEQQPGNGLVAQQLASVMLVQALRQHIGEQAPRGTGWLFALSDAQMREAITAMHADPRHPWTLGELATHVGMSRTVFAKTFKSRVGTTAMEYLARWRMMLAGDRLKTSHDTVSMISLSLGYETDSAFGRAFRKFWGCSPREYRRR